MPSPARLSELAMERAGLGIFAVDREYRVVLWNRFMQQHSGLTGTDALGRSLFDCFPNLPVAWLKRKFDTAFLLKSGSFASWQHRPYLLPFEHDRPITGAVDYMLQDCSFIPLIEHGEVAAVCVTITDVTELALAWRERENAVEALRTASERDALTGLYNRRFIGERLLAEGARWTRYHDPFAVLMFDIDHFKHVNDTYGHSTGDIVLRNVADAVGGQLRIEDTLGRYGGEEFIAILSKCTSDDARIAAERIRLAVAGTSTLVSDARLNVTVSVGGCAAYEGMDDADILVKRADVALYDAKHGGRNRVCIAPTPAASTVDQVSMI